MIIRLTLNVIVYIKFTIVYLGNNFMKVFIKIILTIILFCLPGKIFGQYNFEGIDLQDSTIGLLQDGNIFYLITKDKYFALSINDPFDEYYKKIYGDSTLINPNTELKENFNISIIPFINTNNELQNQFTFDEPVKIGLLLQFDKSNELKLTDYGIKFLNSLLRSYQK